MDAATNQMMNKLLTDAGSAVGGQIETALLVIHDYRQAAKEAGAGMGTRTHEVMLRRYQQSRVMATQEALENGEPPSYPVAEDKILKVQFNPSQLTINASSIPREQQDATSQRSMFAAVEDSQLMMSTTLYFDDMDVYDAFMWDKFTSGFFSATGMTNIVKGAQDIKGTGKTRSVQGQVEALVAALRNPYTRTISFRWGDFAFIGQLDTVRATYTMFSTSGRPVRAQVFLRIRHEMDPEMLYRWYGNFDRAFGGKTNDLVKMEQTVGNVINWQL